MIASVDSGFSKHTGFYSRNGGGVGWGGGGVGVGGGGVGVGLRSEVRVILWIQYVVFLDRLERDLNG